MSITPPVAFIIFLAVAFLLSLGAVRMAPKAPTSPEAETSYAGGEDIHGAKKYPGYKNFYPVALFFTVLHVMALLLALMPAGALLLGLAYTGAVCIVLISLTLR